MAYEQRDMSGGLFRNAKKSEETHPNATGTAMIDGVMYYISSWTKTTKSGDKYQSLSFKRKDEAHKSGVSEAKKAIAGPDFNDDIPF